MFVCWNIAAGLFSAEVICEKVGNNMFDINLLDQKLILARRVFREAEQVNYSKL